MHWSDKIADSIIKRNPQKEEYVCAAGISPSGSIHIGNFRDIATSLFVVKALHRKGKKAKLLFSWDNFDRFRKVPVNVAEVDSTFEKYIGLPYVDVPSPFTDAKDSYAHYFQIEFEKSISRFNIQMEYRYQDDMYRSGKYTSYIIDALKKRHQIFDILDSFRTQEAQEGERDNYYPVNIYCSKCGKDETQILSLSDDCLHADYVCKCGHKGHFSFADDYNCKLSWKVDWPMRWLYEGVDFEPGGKDHASPGGSYNTSKIICEKIYGYKPPVFQGYEFIGIKGTTGKMSGSSGLNLTPDTLLKIYQPEIILWLYAKVEPNKAFDFCFDDGILRQYFEFDKQYNQYISGQANEHIRDIMKSCLMTEEKINTVPMSLLVQLGSVVDFSVPLLETVFAKIGTPYKYDDFKDRLSRAKYWLKFCSPENANNLKSTRDWDLYDSLTSEERQEIEVLYDYILKQEYGLDDLNQKLYSIPKEIYGEDNTDIKSIQSRFFENIYKLILGKEKGPRLYLFLYAIEKERFLFLLDFSTPKTEAEKNPNLKIDEKKEPKIKKVYGEPDEVAAIKPEIVLEDFTKLDLRVCKVIKCSEIRKSHSCYKLTLNDGIKNRTIVSSLNKDYQPEELIGKKIIVIANLQPARLAGVTSEGMLLAATNNACGCQIIFVDDIVPVGTTVC